CPAPELRPGPPFSGSRQSSFSTLRNRAHGRVAGRTALATALICAATCASGVSLVGPGGDFGSPIRSGLDASAVDSGFSITLDIVGGFTPSQEQALINARDFWQSVLRDYQPTVLN